MHIRPNYAAMHLATARCRYEHRGFETCLQVQWQGKERGIGQPLSHPSGQLIDLLRQLSAGKDYVIAGKDFEIERSLVHGHVAALSAMANKLQMTKLLSPTSKEREIPR